MRRRGPGSSRSRDSVAQGPESRRAVVRRASLAAGLAWAIVLLGCGSSPTGSDAGALPLTAGRQLLTLSGFAISSDPSLPPCAPAGQPRDGTLVNTVVLLTSENGSWVARSALNFGTIELHLRPSGTAVTGYGVTGTISGTAIDVGLMGVPRDVQVTLGSSSSGAATFDGESNSKTSSFMVGRIAGAVRFSDSQGVSSTCSAIQWSMQPY